MAEEKKVKLNVSITFVALHRIRRPSWIHRGVISAYSDVAVNESNDNILGLHKLHKAGVKLSCFSPNTWNFLYTFLGNGFPKDSTGNCFSGKYSGASRDARWEEDRWMQADLAQILKGGRAG